MNETAKEKLFILFEKLKKDKKALIIIAIGFFGVMLIFFSEFIPQKKSGDIEDNRNTYFIYDAYKDQLEEIIGKIRGAGEVRVMITYEGSSESVYAKDTSEQMKGEEQKTDSEHIILDKGNEEDGLLLKEIYPRVSGVAVVCEGGGDPTVKNEITLMLKALFGIGSNCISVSEMNV